MSTFTSFSDVLPDPNNKINNAGAADASGSAGPGFAKIKFTSQNQTQVSRTISGRGITSSPGYHMWSFDIQYNPITREEFDPVASFLESRGGRLKPFYVILPQHSRPSDSIFAAYCTLNSINTPVVTNSGVSYILMGGFTSNSGDPKPGDFFNIEDPADINHKKAYKVIRVEDDTTYNSIIGAPSTGVTSGTRRRVWVHPAVTRPITIGATVRFINPKFRVIQKGDTVEYDLDTDNLYQFSLSLEEILP